MHPENVHFAVANDDVRFLDVCPAGANGFDFPTLQHDTCLVPVFDEVVVESFFVGNDAHRTFSEVAAQEC